MIWTDSILVEYVNRMDVHCLFFISNLHVFHFVALLILLPVLLLELAAINIE